MIAILIPFFLVAQIPVDENAWRFGPEYTFQVNANLTANSENEVGLTSNTTALLRCRPKDTNALSCHLENPECFKGTYDKTQGINSTEIRRHPLSLDQFEIKFNSTGVNSLVIPKNISILNLNIIKSFVNLLSIGANLSEKQNQAEFEVKENSTIGECKVNFKITHKPKEQSARKDSPFVLDILPLPDKVSKGSVEIEKTRNLKDCTNFVNYLWGNFGDDKANSTEVGIDTQLDSVIVWMNITDRSFCAHTHTEATKVLDSKKRKFKVVEKLSLTLKSIEAAKDKLPVISNPGTTPILTKINVEEAKA